MREIMTLFGRNNKLFFMDKGMFFTSLITPVILLVLYATFLGNVYRDSFVSAMPDGFTAADSLVNGMVGGQLVSSLLAVCCVTVSFCSNLLMVQDKINGAIRDLMTAPVKRSALAISYFISSAFVTLIICFAAMLISFAYLWKTGWYLSVGDVLCVMADVILLVLFGTALSSIINCNLSTQGQASAVGTIVSAGYGFLCGAYMPVSNFSVGLQKVLSFLPGTYGTSLLRNHTLGGVFAEMEGSGFPADVIEKIKDSVDCNLYFFGQKVEPGIMYIILGGSVILLTVIYILINAVRKKAH